MKLSYAESKSHNVDIYISSSHYYILIEVLWALVRHTATLVMASKLPSPVILVNQFMS